MKESILDVLLYLFEHYFSEDADLIRDRDSLQNGLIRPVSAQPRSTRRSTGSMPRPRSGRAWPRLGSMAPCACTTAPSWTSWTWNAAGSCCTEQHGILDADQRELVLDRAMALTRTNWTGRPEVGRADGAVQPARLRGGVCSDGDADVHGRARTPALTVHLGHSAFRSVPVSEWFHAEGNRQQGPLPAEQLVELFRNNQISPTPGLARRPAAMAAVAHRGRRARPDRAGAGRRCTARGTRTGAGSTASAAATGAATVHALRH